MSNSNTIKQGTDLIDLWRLLKGVIFGMDLRSDLKSGLNYNYLHIHVHIAYIVWILLTASEATMASKQRWRSDLTSDLKSVTSITYMSMCMFLICFGPILVDSQRGHYSLQMASELKFYLGFGICHPNCI